MPLRKLTLPAVLSLGFGLGAFAVDDHGDTCETATAFVVDGDPAGGVIDPGTDEDWLSIDVEANHEYGLTVMVQSAGFQAYWHLYEADCSTVVAADWSSTSSYPFVPLASGTHYLRVITSRGMGLYEVALEDWEEVIDDHGNDRDSATVLATDGTPVSGEINHETDVDYFRFSGQERDLYAIEFRIPDGWRVVGELLDRGGRAPSLLSLRGAMLGRGSRTTWARVRRAITTWWFTAGLMRRTRCG
ncbi:MAG: hypothetical protein V3U60_09020 [Gammaproteobacteria bacterium]